MLYGGDERRYKKGTKEELYKKQKGQCMYCGIKLNIRYFHIDHKTPIARGGGNTPGNRQLLCAPCNNRKGDLTDGEFRRKYKLTPSRKAKGPPSRILSQTRFIFNLYIKSFINNFCLCIFFFSISYCMYYHCHSCNYA